jgi:four helix bundle protein
MAIQRFEDMEAWQTARKLTRLVYEWTKSEPFASDYGLRDQMRRAAVSIMSNIAEGFESRTTALFIDYLGHAKGSAGELRAQVYVALDAGYITEEQSTQIREMALSCSRQTSGLMAYLKTQKVTKLRESTPEYEVT